MASPFVANLHKIQPIMIENNQKVGENYRPQYKNDMLLLELYY
jgi:hypothetical protein